MPSQIRGGPGRIVRYVTAAQRKYSVTRHTLAMAIAGTGWSNTALLTAALRAVDIAAVATARETYLVPRTPRHRGGVDPAPGGAAALHPHPPRMDAVPARPAFASYHRHDHGPPAGTATHLLAAIERDTSGTFWG